MYKMSTGQLVITGPLSFGLDSACNAEGDSSLTTPPRLAGQNICWFQSKIQNLVWVTRQILRRD